MKTVARLLNPDCAANGGPTLSRVRGEINNEMRECIVCQHACRWDVTEHPFFGFRVTCPELSALNEEQSGK